ncbi:Uncharacterised protein [Mycobacteroides abscessus subsp. abscessus]|nr:Uncharacterised protein [Mycobacteroides abscessus subsp. abscessus]
MTLPAGEVDTTLRHRHLQSGGVLANEAGRLCHLKRSPHLVFGGICLAVTQIALHGSGEQVTALGYQTHYCPQVFRVIATNIVAAHAY